MTTKEIAYQKISELVERFEQQYDSYKNSDYNETLTRRDFIDPFFKALGWDIDNENGYAESYREVVHEDKIKIGGSTKAPDYSFRISDEKRLFFVEAKKPCVNIKDEIQPAFQVRHYGWNAQLSVSIVTDFEEFAVYNCTRKPNKTDKATVARIEYFTFRDYISKFDFFWDTFSKEAVLKGKFDKYSIGIASKKGTETVDKDFLKSLDNWRTNLATSISWNNKNLDDEEINYVVQQTIDRIIFLRIAEGRGVEIYGNLQNAAKQGDCYQNLFRLFQDADEKFNSGLFDLEKDKISRNIKVDNKIIKNIINDLYPPISPYEFSIISVEILGSAYEQFLGKTITIDKAHRAKIEEKPEVRKAGGVYYTPQYIVDYIVKNTVGKLIENSPSPSGRAGVGLTPKEVSKIKIVDPACGSGSFLIGAYQYLLNWHTNYYSKNNKPSKGTKTDLLTPSGRLCTSEKKRILLNNIYGVDIDVNAVEVTKLSLLLKCLEGETTFSIENQLRLFKERVLPTLENNIKSGNSLIDTDIYDSQLDFGEEKKIKPFNWQKAFPEVFNRLIENNETDDLKALAKKAKEHAKKAMEYATELEEIINIVSEPITYYGKLGGFDVVIGNPPYGANFNEDEKKYILSKYHFQNYQLDSYLIFLEKSIKGLLKTGSKLGMIIPNPWLTNLLQKNIRKFVFENTIVDEIVHFKKPVFEQATVDTEIVLLTKNQNKNNQINIVVVEKDKSLLLDNHINIKHKQKEWITENGNAINIFLSETDKILFNKILKNTKPLEEYFSINVGIKPYQVGKGKPKQTRADVDNRVFDSDKPENDLYRKYLRGSDIHQYSTIPLKERYLKFGEWLAEPRLSANFDAEIKIFMRQTGDSLIGTLDTKQFLCLNNMHVLVPKDEFSRQCKYFLGIINSKLMNWYYQTINPEKGEALAEVKKSNVAKLPMLYSSEQKQLEIIKFVDKLLQLNEEIQTIKLQSKIEQFKQHIEHCEDSINKKVYEIYELTKEEIEIVEGK